MWISTGCCLAKTKTSWRWSCGKLFSRCPTKRTWLSDFLTRYTRVCRKKELVRSLAQRRKISCSQWNIMLWVWKCERPWKLPKSFILWIKFWYSYLAASWMSLKIPEVLWRSNIFIHFLFVVLLAPSLYCTDLILIYITSMWHFIDLRLETINKPSTMPKNHHQSLPRSWMTCCFRARCLCFLLALPHTLLVGIEVGGPRGIEICPNFPDVAGTIENDSIIFKTLGYEDVLAVARMCTHKKHTLWVDVVPSLFFKGAADGKYERTQEV